MNSLKKFFLLLNCAFFCSLSGLSATSLEDAKASGQVGETSTGYVEVVTSLVTPAIWKLVREENAKRIRSYRQEAAKQVAPVITVEAQAGRKAIAEAKEGYYIKVGYGSWTQKKLD